LENCKISLLKIKSKKLAANFFEGMACSGGCVGGPATLTDLRVATKLVENYANTALAKVASENEPAMLERNKGIDFHHHAVEE